MTKVWAKDLHVYEAWTRKRDKPNAPWKFLGYQSAANAKAALDSARRFFRTVTPCYAKYIIKVERYQLPRRG